MSPVLKITVIGAGSATFSLGLVKDICLTEGLASSHITFMDVDAGRLEMIYKLASRYAQELGANLTFDRTTDRRRALREADFVINTASVVGHEDAIDMMHLGGKHGHYYNYATYLAVYVHTNSLFMLDVARDMEELCPEAWLIQSGNPVFEGCTLMTRKTGIRVCGLCHGHYGYRRICDQIGIDWRQVTWQAPGLNHNIWLTHFLYQGQNAYPLVDEWIRSKGEAYWELNTPTRPLPESRQGQWTPELQRAWEIELSRAAVHQYHMYGLLPIGDTPRNGGWWYHADLAARKYWYGEPYGGQDTELSWPLYVQNLEKRVAEIARLAQDPAASLVQALGATKTQEQQVPIIDGLVNNTEGQFQVNVPNNGALQGLPDDVVVEVPAIVNQKGIQPLRVGSLPRKIMLEQILPNWLEMERQLLAIETGDRSILLWNRLHDGRTHSYEQACAFLEDLLDQSYNQEMNAHYHWPANWIG